MKILFFFTLFSCCKVFKLNAQEVSIPEMITDRPDVTESPSVVPIGYLQIETGAFYEESGKIVKQKTTVFNTTLLRYGLLERLELRLGWDIAEVLTETNRQNLSDIASGLSPLLVGAKIAVAEEKGMLPEIGLLGHLYMPFSASSDFRTETTGVNFIFSFAHTLSEKSNLGYNLGAEWGNDSSEAAYTYSLSYGYGITNTFGMYAELYGNFPEDSSANHLWDAGITYLIYNSIQLDATIGSGITEGQNLLASAGISIRLPR